MLVTAAQPDLYAAEVVPFIVVLPKLKSILNVLLSSRGFSTKKKHCSQPS